VGQKKGVEEAQMLAEKLRSAYAASQKEKSVGPEILRGGWLKTRTRYLKRELCALYFGCHDR
jgi:hypothetical protein